MRIFIFIFLLLMTNTVFSLTKIKGFLASGVQYPLTTFKVPSLSTDPILEAATHSDFASMAIINLHYLDKNTNSKQLDLTKYDTILVSGNFDLISYDKNTGSFSYRFSLSNNLTFTSAILNNIGQNKHLSGKIFFAKNHTPELMINGKLFYKKNKPDLTKIDLR